MAPRNRCSGADGSSRRLQERSGSLKTAARALREASRRLQERSERPQDALRSDARGFKTAPRALTGFKPRCFKSGGFPKSIFERSRGCSRSLNIKPTWIWGSTSPQVGVQKHIRRTCSIPLSSIQQASGRLSPCMSMHGLTLVLNASACDVALFCPRPLLPWRSSLKLPITTCLGCVPSACHAAER